MKYPLQTDVPETIPCYPNDRKPELPLQAGIHKQ
jgi:hypothetical protein